MARRQKKASAVLRDRPETELVRTLVWELPVRLSHWTLVLSILVLSVTGLYIHGPFLPAPAGSGSLMAWMRSAHVVFGFVLTAALSVRIYWFFRGNFWAHWSAFIPIHDYQWKGIGATLQYYAFLRFKPQRCLGNNALAATGYVFMYLLLVFQVLSGFAMLVGVVGTPAMKELLGWLPALASLPYMRLAHYLITWMFMVFLIIHVYLSVLISIEEENGLLDSIFSGYKFVPVGALRAEVDRTPELRTFEVRHEALPEGAPAEKEVRPSAPGPSILYQNWFSYAGTAIAAAGLVVFLVLLSYHTIGGGSVGAPYGDIVIFLGTPMLLGIGVILVLVGMYVEWLRWRRVKPLNYPRYPRWDFNVPKDRRALLYCAIGGLLILVTSLYTAAGAYVYTDSDKFCGAACHVMDPEGVTHATSTHARVECAACHLGAGVTSYVVAKTHGMRELYSTLTNDVPRPIPSPVHELRPIRESCERCHWPEKRFGGTQRRLVYFASDETNTRWEVDLLLYVGGGRPDSRQPFGIHWHVTSKVEYVAADELRQHIPWVRSVDPVTGVATVYTSDEEAPAKAKGSDTGSPAAPLMEMTCIDCHNRPVHVLAPPTTAVDSALASGAIDTTLPFVRREAVGVLSARYLSREAAHQAILRVIPEFYEKSHPAVFAKQRKDISMAVSALTAIYDRYFFPSMNERWDTYPDNAGHLVALGCLRCHDGKHRSTDGKTISDDCDTCHAIQRQGTPGKFKVATSETGLDFEHPVDVGTAWAEQPCTGCHSGGAQ